MDAWFFTGCETKEEWADAFHRMMDTPYSPSEKKNRDYQRSWKRYYIKEGIIPFYHNDRAMNRDLKALNAYKERLISFEWLRWILARSNFLDYDDIPERVLQNFLRFAGWLNY